MLTEALAAVAEDDGFHKMIGKLFPDNVASVRMVERCGFASVGLHRRHGQLDGVWRDVLVVERLLAPRPPGRSSLSTRATPVGRGHKSQPPLDSAVRSLRERRDGDPSGA